MRNFIVQVIAVMGGIPMCILLLVNEDMRKDIGEVLPFIQPFIPLMAVFGLFAIPSGMATWAYLLCRRRKDEKYQKEISEFRGHLPQIRAVQKRLITAGQAGFWLPEGSGEITALAVALQELGIATPVEPVPKTVDEIVYWSTLLAHLEGLAMAGNLKKG